MSSRTYMPYINGYMQHVERIYDWNQKVDEMRIAFIKEVHSYLPRWTKVPAIETPADYQRYHWYNFNDGLRIFYEERNEYTQAKLNNDKEEMVDALIDQFIVAIGEIRKCALSDNYEHIEFWEDKVNESLRTLSYELCVFLKTSRLIDACITEVLDALFTRFGDDAYIDSKNKFIKSKSYRKPNLSAILTVKHCCQ